MHLPVDFAQYTAQLMGDARYNTFVQALEQEAPVSIRLNPLKHLHGVPAAAATQPVPWCEEGRYLSHRPNFTADPLLRAETVCTRACAYARPVCSTWRKKHGGT